MVPSGFRGFSQLMQERLRFYVAAGTGLGAASLLLSTTAISATHSEAEDNENLASTATKSDQSSDTKAVSRVDNTEAQGERVGKGSLHRHKCSLCLVTNSLLLTNFLLSQY